MNEQTAASLKERVGQQLKDLRKKQKLTLMQAQEKTGQSFSVIGEIERGTRNVSLDVLEKLLAGYGVSIEFKFKKQGE